MMSSLLCLCGVSCELLVDHDALALVVQHPKRVFEGEALLRRLTRMGILNENEQKLDYVLGLTSEKFLVSFQLVFCWATQWANAIVGHRTVVCRPVCSPLVWPSPSTTHVSSSDSATSESVAVW